MSTWPDSARLSSENTYASGCNVCFCVGVSRATGFKQLESGGKACPWTARSGMGLEMHKDAS